MDFSDGGDPPSPPVLPSFAKDGSVDVLNYGEVPLVEGDDTPTGNEGDTADNVPGHAVIGGDSGAQARRGEIPSHPQEYIMP